MLEEVKQHLRILENDEDKYLQKIINDAEMYLNELIGVELNYNEGLSKILLLNYCRYVYNNASEYFEENFQKEILRLQLMKAVDVNDQG